ncbi:hypothetical protein E2C01_065665 [Portunus trituberculatus]|uniref:Septin-type G domain-containing protein n=1 Tax=Portunus trituberculatus TaxID=210409 RepID=A0A5B7HRR3_PORTR|nr:hypothetical protein [Portunus trituberculatus]
MAGSGQTPLKLSVLQRTSPVQGGTPSIYAIPMEHTVRDEDGCFEKLEFGRSIQIKTNKVIMMVGETGSGNTTLINGLVDYVLGVDWDDKIRFKMIVEDSSANQAESQTKDVTSYTLHHQDVFRSPYSLTIIDTPGFGDTKGIKRDKEIVEQLRKFFTSPGDRGNRDIDAIGFVVQSSQTDKTQRFGSLFREMGCESFQIFPEKLRYVESKSLILTKDVLQERKRIEVYIEGIQKEITVGLSKQNTLEKEKKLLKEHEINMNKNFTIEVEEDVFEKKYSDGRFNYRKMRNCLKCESTSCQNCLASFLLEGIFEDGGSWCSVMDESKKCVVCPLHCSLDDNEMCDYIFCH